MISGGVFAGANRSYSPQCNQEYRLPRPLVVADGERSVEVTAIARNWPEVVGVGPQIGFLLPVGDMQGYLKLKAYGEFDAANRPSGWETWITFAISTPAPGAPPTTKPIVRKY